MNTRLTMPTATNDPDFIHNSTRTTLSTNADPTGCTPARVTLRTSRLVIRWLDGDVDVRFAAQDADVTPRGRAAPRTDKR
ncbi:hypothetical protein ABIC94_002121 [Variovorax paradoxus]|uniref:hypothetical protein n=1 Tax=Variovorax paradoxus TaxID=34073 RepID=UPI00339297F6